MDAIARLGFTLQLLQSTEWSCFKLVGPVLHDRQTLKLPRSDCQFCPLAGTHFTVN